MKGGAEEAEVATVLQALEERLMDPEVRGQPEEVGALLDEGFTEIGRTGRPWSRAAMLEQLRMAPDPGGPRTVAEFEARVLAPEVVLGTYRVPGSGTRRSSVWRRVNTRWRLAFHQGTAEAAR